MNTKISHEISHSWTGSLVTNINWENFWLNEGFTVFFERKSTEIIYGKDMSNLDGIVGFKRFQDALNKYGLESTLTSLHPNLENLNPDRTLNSVPYQKGSYFLYYLEKLVGKTNFQTILKAYVNSFKLKSIDYTSFKILFENQVRTLIASDKIDVILNSIDWESWIYHPGQVPVFHEFSKKYKIKI